MLMKTQGDVGVLGRVLRRSLQLHLWERDLFSPFSGDIFEMEDQRNWTDASYKTYSTPLALPFPVEVTAGTSIAQSVTLTLEGDHIEEQVDAAQVRDSATVLTLDPNMARSLPQIGLGMASHGA